MGYPATAVATRPAILPFLEPLPLAEELASLPHAQAQHRLLAEQIYLLDDDGRLDLAHKLKQQADRLMRTDIRRCLQVATLIQMMSGLTGDPCYRALGLRAEGNAYAIGLGQYQKGLDCYDKAAAIYADLGDELNQAQAQIGKLWALTSLGRSAEALSIGRWANGVLHAHRQWQSLATLTSNMAIIYGRLGQDTEALSLLEQAATLYDKMELDDAAPGLMVKMNRAIVLRNLGRFDKSIAANEAALDGYRRLGEIESIARAQQNLAMTYFVLGRYNEALALLDEARERFLADGRHRHAMLVELFTGDCLLQLGRYADALEKCQRARSLFDELGAPLEVGQCLLNEASGYIGLARYDEALATLAEARQFFTQQGNETAVADADLQGAAVHLEQGDAATAMAQARACASVFRRHNQPVDRGRAYLLAARAALTLAQPAQAEALAAQALSIGQARDVPALIYQAQHLRGRVMRQRGEYQEALLAMQRAIKELERLYGRLMIEFRADFARDKERLYEDAVALCLELNQPALALSYAERAKSRALHDLLAHRLDMQISPRSATDQPLVDELSHLRRERDRLYRRWQTGEAPTPDGVDGDEARQQVQARVVALEKRITALWHKLLIRNADYARDAALWQVRTEPVQPYLDPGTALLEYFSIEGQFVAFWVTADGVTAAPLAATVAEVRQLLQRLWLNLRAVPRTPVARQEALTHNAQGILQQLHQLLVAPLIRETSSVERLIVVPHGPLHYLPFAALHDGVNYLLQQTTVSYLPGSSMLRLCREAETAAKGFLAVGCAENGRLPQAPLEAQAVAAGWSGRALMDEAATLDAFRAAAPGSRIIHLAAHGEFRADNPLFSGLALADGWLTTLDIFNLRLSASLVTLSACETGRSVIGGGDELLGLMRAFLSAGAASLVATHWQVEDSATAQLMDTFYHALAAGVPKGNALRQAQLSLLDHHPYFWAPFFLVGDAAGKVAD